MLNNYTFKQPKLPLKQKISKTLKQTTLKSILDFSKSLEVIKGRKENIEIVLN